MAAMVGAVIVAVLLAQSPVDYLSGDVGVRITRLPDGTYVESYLAKDARGKMRVILTSPTIGNLAVVGKPRSAPLLQIGSEGLFEAPPTFSFSEVKSSGKTVVELVAKADGYSIVKTIQLPASGQLVHVTVRCSFQKENPVIRYLLDTYAFAPDGKPMKAYGKPDATFAPAIRPRKDGVIGDHFFRSPVMTVQEGELAASVMPDLDVLKDNRFLPTIADLDAANGVVDAPLISYGFADYKLTGHVYFANDSSMTRPTPPELLFAHHILLDAKAEPYGAYQKAAKWQWDAYGHRYLDKTLPQAMPFEEYAKVCYPAAFNEKETGGWFEHQINGQTCGGMPSGWGRHEGWVSWQPWFNQLRSAWGLRWWGRKTGNKEWIDKADKMLNLALAAPMDRGAVPTTYQSKQKTWKGSLITPDPRCYYDLTNIAWKGIWMLRWLELEDCPRRGDVLSQCEEMSKLLISKQNLDGSFPTWLDKDLNAVPVLDRSAQSALPLWFLAEYELYKVNTERAEIMGEIEKLSQYPGKRDLDPFRMRIDSLNRKIAELSKNQTLRAGADFLAKDVVNGQYWYDFETFFSCSPKACFQRDGQDNHEKMRDPHTLQAPQNTLCMHWAAEALDKVADVFEKANTAAGAVKQPAGTIASWRKASLMSLDTMVLTQNVWPISYRKAAYTYGGFGVQNSDGEYNDARQAQFGDTLADFGAALGRQDYFERGVAAIRASMALINHPLHIKLGIYPNPNYPLGLQPENTGHGGTDQQNGRTGPDWGEMSGLTSMAWLLHKYGGAYVHKSGWRVGIDGVLIHPQTNELAAHSFLGMASGNQFFDFKTDFNAPNGRIGKSVRLIPEPYDFGFIGVAALPGGQDEYAVVLEVSGTRKVTGYEGRFINGRGQSVKADVGSGGASDGGGTARATITPDFASSPIRFEGEVEGWKIATDPVQYFVNPQFDMQDWRMPGWTFNGDFLHWPVRNPRNFNWNNGGLPFIGTCENGRGAFDDEFTGTIESPWFLITKPTLRLNVGGGAGQGVYVELIHSAAAPPHGDMNQKQIHIARGQNSESMREVVWDVTKYRGQYLKIRIVDQEKEGWGHINVGNIRCN